MPSGTDYPPEHHLGRDLGIAYRVPEPGRIQLTADCTEEVLRPDRTVMTEAVCSIVDEAIGFVAVLAVLPDWGSTAALSLDLTNRAVEPKGKLHVDGLVVKAGKRLVFTQCSVRWNDLLVAHARGQFARVGRAGANQHMDIPTPDPGEVFRMGTDEGHLAEHLGKSLGIRPAESGALEMRFDEYVSNSSGILHGGVACALVLASAEAAADAPVRSADVQFLSPGRQGPFVAIANRIDEEQPGVWQAETTDSATSTLMNRAVVRTP
ncbi:MAG: acyl-CoA thioesterase domain-containing protein [Microthrixaceae bacterium]